MPTSAADPAAVKTIVEFARDSLFIVMVLSLLPLLAGFFVGSLFSFIGTIFQIQDSSFSYVPKLAAVISVIYLFMNFGIERLSEFAVRCLDHGLSILPRFFQ